MGYSSDSTVVHTQGNQSYTTSAAVSSYASSTDKPRQFTFTHSATGGNKTYINGVLAAEDATKTAHLTGITELVIGKGYTGEIGEIAMFARSLKPDELQAVEDYAGKKWSRKVLRDSVSSASCTSGVVTDSGCDMSNAPCSISVAGFVDRVTAASSVTSVTCNQPHYSGSISYTCVNGSPNVTGSCSCATGYSGSDCSSCAAGYENVSGSCSLISCDVSGTGIASGTKVNQVSGTGDCNAAGYDGTYTYTCSMGVGTVTNNSCGPDTKCTGGTRDIVSAPGYVIHKFTSSGTLTCPENKSNVQYLIVAGGGGGGGANAAGGAGGVLTGTFSSLTASTNYSVVVGAGGAGATSPTLGGNGSSSSFNGLTAIGGGGGAHNTAGNLGGSGGGGGYSNGAGGAGTSGQGNSGGNGITGASYCGGGGGGAGGAGGNATNSGGLTYSGVGGAGISSSITGTSVYYGVGGAGSGYFNCQTTAAPGGSSAMEVGAPNTGNGGGGGYYSSGSFVGKSGGSGIVVIRYAR